MMEDFLASCHGILHCQVKLFVNLCKLQNNINSKSWGENAIVATLALARDQGKGVTSVRAYK
jgi:hypothetical protein